jgi:hypothetical protein
VLRIRVEKSGVCSPALPASVDRAFQPLLSAEPPGRVVDDRLSKLSIDQPSDSNETEIAEVDACAVVADGTEALRIVIDGLRRRLAHPLEPSESLVLFVDRP